MPAACGTQAQGAQWIGGDADASDISTRDNYGEQTASVAGGSTYVAMFALSDAASVRIEAADRGNGDPTLSLLNAEGTEIGSDDDSGGNGAARLETELEAGAYCAVVRGYNETSLNAFVRIGRTEMEALTPGADAASGNADATPDQVRQNCENGPDLGVLGEAPLTQNSSASQTPFARFTLDAAKAISITATNSEADPTLTLLDANGGMLAENDDFSGLNSRIDQSTPLDAGSYCVNVGAISDPALPIAVEVSLYDEAAALQALYKLGEAAPPLDGTVVPVADLGVLQNRLHRDVQLGSDAQWFKVTFEEPSLILAEANSVGGKGDPWMVLYDDLGRQIALNDDNGSSTDAQISARVLAGTYMIGVKQVQDRSGFVRLLMERFIAAE
ncbi:ABC transporter substrate-binding protein [Rhodobacteraceae bacterium]|nr:ABC transporter substrate-binding protein [Paracoccaceae bacterium]